MRHALCLKHDGLNVRIRYIKTFALVVMLMPVAATWHCGPAPAASGAAVTVSTSSTSFGFVHPTQRSAELGGTAVFQLVPDRGHRVSHIETVGSRPACEGTLTGMDYIVPFVTGECMFRPVFEAVEYTEVSALFEPRMITQEDYSMTYHVHRPNVIEGIRYPLILAVHGTIEGLAAAAGDSNPHLIYTGEGVGRPVATAWVQPHVRQAYPAFVVAPLGSRFFDRPVVR